MQISTFTMYLLMKLDRIVQVCGGISFFSVVSVVIFGVVYFSAEVDTEKEVANKAARFIKHSIVVFSVSFLLWVSLPTTKQAATLIVLPKVINSDFVQKDLPADANEIYTLAREYIKEQLSQRQ